METFIKIKYNDLNNNFLDLLKLMFTNNVDEIVLQHEKEENTYILRHKSISKNKLTSKIKKNKKEEFIKFLNSNIVELPKNYKFNREEIYD